MYWGILCWYPVILIRLSLCSKQKQKYLSALGNQSENVTYFVTQLDLSSFDGLCNYRASDFLHISSNYEFKMRENLKRKQSFQLLVKDDSSCWLFVLLHLTCLLSSCFSPWRLFLPHFFLQSAGVCSACWQQRKCVLVVVLPTRNRDYSSRSHRGKACLKTERLACVVLSTQEIFSKFSKFIFQVQQLLIVVQQTQGRTSPRQPVSFCPVSSHQNFWVKHERGC